MRLSFTKYILRAVLSLCKGAQLFSCVWLIVTPWTVTHQASLSMKFFRQEHWSGLPFPSPGDLPNTGIKPMSSASPELAGGFFTTESPGNPMQSSPLPCSRIDFKRKPWTQEEIISYPFSPSPWQSLIGFLSLNLPSLSISYECNHAVGDLLCLPFFT